MKIDYIKIRDFYEDPYAIRERALKAEYEEKNVKHYPGADAGTNYNYTKEVNKISAVLGVPLNNHCIGRFRSSLYSDTGKALRNIHTDLLSYTTIVSLTLNDNPHGVVKTALWKHRETGVARMDCKEVMDHSINWETIVLEEGRNEDLWELDTLVEIKFNEALIIDGNLFHSPYPDGFGDCLENSRLTQNFFLNRIMNG